MDPSAAAARQWAEQLLSVAEKLLVARDLEGCKEFSSQALDADPNTPGAEDLHAAASVLLAAKRRRLSDGKPDPYAVLGLDPANHASRQPDAIHSHYRRLSFLLNRSRPDRPFSFAFTNAAKLVADALNFLSNTIRKSALDADLNSAAAAAARAYQSPAADRRQSQSPLPVRPNPPFAIPPPRPTPPPASSPPWPTPPSAVPSPRLTLPPAAPSARSTAPRASLTPRQTSPLASRAPRPTPPPVASPPRPQPPPAASPPRPQPPPAAPPPRPQPQSAASPPWQTPSPAVSPPRPAPPPAGPQTRPTPPAPATQTPVVAMVSPVASDTSPSSTFWTVCTACRHIHQYDRLYEACKLLCPSCRQSFVAEAMAEPPPIVPGTDMYYCTWGFFPVGFPGCSGFERFVNSQSQGPDHLNAPWLRGSAGVKGNAQDAGVTVNAGDAGVKGNAGDSDVKGNAENGVPVTAAAEIPVDVPATTPPAKPMRVKVGAKKRGRPKGSKNKNKL